MSALSRAVDQVEQRAAKVDLGRILLALLALPFFVLGWTARYVVRVLTWCWAAVQVGWQLATQPRQPGGS